MLLLGGRNLLPQHRVQLPGRLGAAAGMAAGGRVQQPLQHDKDSAAGMAEGGRVQQPLQHDKDSAPAAVEPLEAMQAVAAAPVAATAAAAVAAPAAPGAATAPGAAGVAARPTADAAAVAAADGEPPAAAARGVANSAEPLVQLMCRVPGRKGMQAADAEVGARGSWCSNGLASAAGSLPPPSPRGRHSRPLGVDCKLEPAGGRP
jgi:hypothetical protein